MKSCAECLARSGAAARPCDHNVDPILTPRREHGFTGFDERIVAMFSPEA